MGRGTLRGAFTAWLSLIALHTIATSGGGRISEAFSDVTSILERVLDPTVPAIPDRSSSATAPYTPGPVVAGRPPSGPAAPLLGKVGQLYAQ